MLALTRKKGESLVVNNNIEITVLEIRGDQVKIGLSSIYRNLAALTKAGFILQTISQDSKEARYRYVSPETCGHRLHLTCLRCGKTFHMTQKLSDRLLTDILRVEDFAVDENQTTVYGLCRDCREQRN